MIYYLIMSGLQDLYYKWKDKGFNIIGGGYTMAQKGFYYDMSACIGCKVCQIACKDINGLEVGLDYRNVEYFEEGKFPNPKFYYMSMSCNHCGEPKCVPVCPVEALSKDKETGLVLHDKELCIGCQACVAACPYEAIHYKEEEEKVGKCDGCISLFKKDEKPACVTGCLARVLDFGDLNELKDKYKGKNLSNLEDKGNTKPSVLIKK